MGGYVKAIKVKDKKKRKILEKYKTIWTTNEDL